jgi:hypothetical protein
VRDLHSWIEFSDRHGYIDVNTLRLPNIGNPYGGIFNDEVLLTGSSMHSHYYAEKIDALLCGINNPVVIEIGGGVGTLAYYLMTINPDILYLNFDLPEILAINQYFLMMTFPHKNFKLGGEDIQDFDMALLPTCDFDLFGDDCCDVIINFHSMSEMPQYTVTHYLERIAKMTRNYFYHENSCVQQEYNETDTSNFNCGNLRRIYVSPSVWSESIYREHLYKRV